MFSTEQVRFNYRIIINNNTYYPFRIQKKVWIFWLDVGRCETKEEAEREIKELAKLEMMRPGTVVSEYNEQDYLADKLRNHKQ